MRKYSDTLAIFLLKAHAPEKYRENTRMELTGANGEPLTISPEAAAAEMRKIVEDVANRRKAEAPPPTTPAPTPDDADDGSEEDEP